jgi:hypothetical protein
MPERLRKKVLAKKVADYRILKSGFVYPAQADTGGIVKSVKIL